MIVLALLPLLEYSDLLLPSGNQPTPFARSRQVLLGLERELPTSDMARHVRNHLPNLLVVRERGFVLDAREVVIPRLLAMRRNRKFVRILRKVAIPLFLRDGLPGKRCPPDGLIVVGEDCATGSAEVHPEDVALNDVELLPERVDRPLEEVEVRLAAILGFSGGTENEREVQMDVWPRRLHVANRLTVLLEPRTHLATGFV